MSRCQVKEPESEGCQPRADRIGDNPQHAPEQEVRAGQPVLSACQKMDICLNPKNKWRFKIAKNFDVR